jgi:hypothetical protein
MAREAARPGKTIPTITTSPSTLSLIPSVEGFEALTPLLPPLIAQKERIFANAPLPTGHAKRMHLPSLDPSVDRSEGHADDFGGVANREHVPFLSAYGTHATTHSRHKDLL